MSTLQFPYRNRWPTRQSATVPTMPMRWRIIDTSPYPGRYITGELSLNLPFGTVADWHPTVWKTSCEHPLSTRSRGRDACCTLGNALWEVEGLVDARDALQQIGHPQGDSHTVIWAAKHARAVAEMVLTGLFADKKIYSPDPRTVIRWLSRKKMEECRTYLQSVQHRLSLEQADELRSWMERTYQDPLLHVNNRTS